VRHEVKECPRLDGCAIVVGRNISSHVVCITEFLSV
jgi:hypothetical protein